MDGASLSSVRFHKMRDHCKSTAKGVIQLRKDASC